MMARLMALSKKSISKQCARYHRWATFWLGIGAAQKGAKSKGVKPTDRRHWVIRSSSVFCVLF
jgi:hypothetical protein